MSETSTAVALRQESPLADVALATALGLSKDNMLTTIKRQCFKNTRAENISNEQLVAYVQVASALKDQCPGFNPILPGMLYAYPTNNGGTDVMIGPDGIFTVLATNKNIIGGANGEPAWWVEHSKDGDEDVVTAHIRTQSKGVISKTIWVSEWVVQSNPNWKTRRRHMAEIRALKQCARQVIHGIPMDEDDLAIAAAHQGFENAKPVEGATPPPRPARPERKSGVKAAVAETTATPSENPPIDVASEPADTPVAQTEVVEDTKPAKPVEEVSAPTMSQPSSEKSGRGAPQGSGQEQAAGTPLEAKAATPPPAPKPAAKPAPKPSAPTWPMDTIGNIIARRPGKARSGAPLAVLEIETEHYNGVAYAADVNNPLLMDGMELSDKSPEGEQHYVGRSKALFMHLENRGSAEKPLILATNITDKQPEVF